MLEFNDEDIKRIVRFALQKAEKATMIEEVYEAWGEGAGVITLAVSKLKLHHDPYADILMDWWQNQATEFLKIMKKF